MALYIMPLQGLKGGCHYADADMCLKLVKATFEYDFKSSVVSVASCPGSMLDDDIVYITL